MRINRFIARAGVTSRRKAEVLILGGRVKIDGKIVKNLSTNVDEESQVEIDSSPIIISDHKYYLFNKPIGYTTTKSDPFALHTIFELLPRDSSLFPVGRLDRNTSGLILITNDGNFAQNIIHPKNKIEKEYQVRTKYQINPEQVSEIKKGVALEDGFIKPKSIKKNGTKDMTLIIELGKNRIVRRILKAVGNEVSGLHRTRIGSICLDVPVGKYRQLTEKEVENYL